MRGQFGKLLPPTFFSLILTPHTRLSCVCTHTPRTPKQWMWSFCIHYILALSNINLDKSFVRYGVKDVYKEFDPHIFSVISIFYPRLFYPQFVKGLPAFLSLCRHEIRPECHSRFESNHKQNRMLSAISRKKWWSFMLWKKASVPS